MDSGTTEKSVREQYAVPLGVSGLGGWLVLVQIGLYSTIVMLLVQLFQYSFPALEKETWELLTSKDSEYYHVMWGPIISFELVYNVLFLLFCGYILIQFYQRRFILPRLMIIFYCTSLLIGIIDYALLQQIPLAQEAEDGSSLRDIMRSIITCAIWIPYFIKSERVKNTFIR